MRLRRLVLVCALGTAAMPPAAQGVVTCTFNAGGKSLAIAAGANGDTPRLVRQAGGDELIVQSGMATPVACGGGTPTVTTINSVAYNDTSAGGSTTFIVDLAGGPIGPGATAEQFSDSEIELTLTFGTGSDYLLVYGGSGGETLRVGTPAASAFGINVNPGELFQDRDIDATGVEQVGFSLLGGDDSLNLRGGASTGDVVTTTTSIQTGDGNDTVVAGDGQNSVNLGSGDDTYTGAASTESVTPGPGNDSVDGAGGFDSVGHFFTTVPVRVDLAIAGAQDTGEGVDTYSGIEALFGGSGNDILLGNDGANSIYGADGDDLLDGGAGNDDIDGGSGFDTALYVHAPAAVTVTTGKNQQQQDTGGAGLDTVTDVQALTGSAFGDTLTGDGQGNVLDGGPGTDTLFGLGGPDTLLVRDGGADTADCGDGPDTALTDPVGIDALTACETVSAAEFAPADGAADPTASAGGGSGGTGSGGGTAPTAPDTTRPVLSGARFRPAAFRARRGGRLRLTVSEPVALRIAIDRCATKRACRQVRTMDRVLRAGQVVVRVRTRGLRPGRYRARLHGLDAAGNASVERRARFRLQR